MNSTFAVISILIKSNIEEKRLITFWMNVSTKGLKDYLECASTSKGDHLWRKHIFLKDCLWVYDWNDKYKRHRGHINKTSKTNAK